MTEPSERPASLRVLCLPELLLLIAESLGQFDITVCIRVSSCWYSILRLLVWRIVVLDTPTTPPPSPRAFLSSSPSLVHCGDPLQTHHPQGPSLLAAQKSFPVSLLYDNAYHVRSLTEKIPLLETLLLAARMTTLPSFKNLVHLETLTLTESLLDLLKAEAIQQTLESLTCQSMDKGHTITRQDSLASEFWQDLEKLPRLRVLQLQYAVLRKAEVRNFLRVLRQLECLELRNTHKRRFLLLAEEMYCFSRVLETIGHEEEEAAVARAVKSTASRKTTTTAAAASETELMSSQSSLPGTSPEEEFERDATGLLMFSRLRSLTIRCNVTDSAIQLMWLGHFPKLQQFRCEDTCVTSFSVLTRMFNTPIQLASGSLHGAFRTTLQSLNLSRTEVGDSVLLNVMKGLPNLRRLDVSHTLFGEQSAKALLLRERSIRKGKGRDDHGQEETAVTALESLNMKGCYEISSETIQEMLETFSELKEFKAGSLRVRDMVDVRSPPPQPESSDDRSGSASSPNPNARYCILRPWVCLGIEILDIIFCDLAVFCLEMPPSASATAHLETVVRQLEVGQGDSLEGRIALPKPALGQYDNDGVPIPSMAPQAREIVYAQLARLTQLRRLGLGENQFTRMIDRKRPMAHNIRRIVKHAPVLDFTLDHGLEILGSLVRLEDLHFLSASPHLQIADVQWMARAWPRLTRLQGRLSPVDTQHESLVAFLKDCHPKIRTMSSRG